MARMDCMKLNLGLWLGLEQQEWSLPGCHERRPAGHRLIHSHFPWTSFAAQVVARGDTRPTTYSFFRFKNCRLFAMSRTATEKRSSDRARSLRMVSSRG